MKNSIVYFLVLAFALVACQQEVTTLSPDPTSPSGLGMIFSTSSGTAGSVDSMECFEFVYPIIVNMPDGSTISIQDDDDWDAVEAWYDANPSSQTEPTLSYPITVVLGDTTPGTTQVINNDDELEELIEVCEEYEDDECWEHEEECFEFVYPITVTMPDGTAITLNDEDDWDTVDTWYDANPGSDDEPAFTYPLTIIDEDGNTETINNEDELEEAFEECEEWDEYDEYDICFDFVYPVTVTMPDGTSITLSQEDDWDNVEAWYDANPSSDDDPIFSYPLNLIDEDGNTETINNVDELEEAFEECEEYDEHEDCFEFVYPFSVTMPDGSSISLSDEDDWNSVDAWYDANPTNEDEFTFTYPLTILDEDGNTQTISNAMELEAAENSCD